MTNDNTVSLAKKITTWSAWSFLGVILAAVFFYVQEYREKYNFRVEINDVFNLIEVREKISDLKVLYKGVDIVETGVEIKVARITLRNLGETILQQYYDNLESFGLNFPDAQLLNVTVADSSSDDLKKKIIFSEPKNTKDGEDSGRKEGELILSKVIFEEGDFVAFKITLMQKNNAPFKVQPLGKIANLENIDVVNVEIQEEKDSGVRSVLYVFGGFISFFVFMGMLGTYLENRDKNKRSKKVEEFTREHDGISGTQKDIVELFIEGKLPRYGLLRRAVEGEEVISIKSFIRTSLIQGHLPFSSVLALIVTRAGTLQSAPSILYEVKDNKILLNAENAQFIREFYKKVIDDR